MCLDATWLKLVYAQFAGEEPNVTVPGIAYMLQGSSDASNTDPMATEPVIHIPAPDLAVYDALRTGAAA